MLFRTLFSILIAHILASHSAEARIREALSTKAEETQWQETGRYDEVERLCPAFQKAYPQSVRCFSIGTSPEGRPILAMVVGEKGSLQSNTNQKPVIAFQGGIHAGEIDGKDAGFWLLRDILEKKKLPGVLAKLTLLFVPVFNVDGHERFETNSRPNQIGPKEKGWRVTAQNLNLNRDYLKADAPEMQAMLHLLNAWNPILYADLHVTDGAKFQHDIGVMIEPSNAGPQSLRKVANSLSGQVLRDLTNTGHLPVSTYPSFLVDDDPSSGIAAKPARPAFSNGYWAYRNRLGVLVETHSWKPYAHRVKATYETLVSLLSAAMKDAGEWQKASREAEKESLSLVGQPMALAYKSTEKKEIIDFLGYAYTRKLSDVSGQLMTRYDDSKPEIWRIPFYPEVEPKISEVLPKAFLIPVAYRSLFEEKLKLHGIRYEVLKESWEGKTKTFRATSIKGNPLPYESHQKIDYAGQWEATKTSLRPGSLRVDLGQPQARLAMMLIDPLSPDSLFAWGFLNQIFERKEYMEPYVAEEVAEAMLKDPKIKAEFEAKLKDPEFAKDPERRLGYFAEKHPSYDQNYLKYPVLRVD